MNPLKWWKPAVILVVAIAGLYGVSHVGDPASNPVAQGFAGLRQVLTVAVIGVVGYAAYRVWHVFRR